MAEVDGDVKVFVKQEVEEEHAQHVYKLINRGKESCFFTNPNISSGRGAGGAYEWYLNPIDVEDLINYCLNADSDPAGDGSILNQPSVDSYLNSDRDRKLSADIFEFEECNVEDKWVVKIHPDSGLNYFVDVLQEVSTWSNPYNYDDMNEILKKLGMDDSNQNDDKSELYNLMGVEDAPNRDFLNSEYITTTTQQMDEWIQRTGLTKQEYYATSLAYPEYFDIGRDLNSLAKTIQVTIRVPKEVGSNLSNFTLQPAITDTVDKLLDNLFRKFNNVEGKVLDDEGASKYIFKVVGFNEYLLHHGFSLGYYDCTVNALKEKQKLDLHLMKLTQTELMDLDPIMTKAEKHYLGVEISKRARNGDDWTLLEETLAPRISMTNIFLADHIPKSSITWPLRVLVKGISNCPREIPCDFLQIEFNLYYNGETLTNKVTNDDTKNLLIVPFSSDPRFPKYWIDTKFEVASLPSGTRIGFNLVGITKSPSANLPPTRTLIAGVCITLVDYQRHLVTGEMKLNFFPHVSLQVAREPEKFKDEGVPEVLNLATCTPGSNSLTNCGSLHVVFDSYSVPVIAEIKTLNEVKEKNQMPADTPEPTEKERDLLIKIERTDSLYELTTEDKVLLTTCRNWCSKFSRFLPKYLQSVNWTSPKEVEDAYSMLLIWKPPSPLEALGMLDIRYSDPVVREYALRILDAFTDSQIQEYLLQMVQTLKFEPYHDSPLARFLLRRALLSPLVIGHCLFWMLRSEMHATGSYERFGVLLNLYILNCGAHKASLQKQSFVNEKIKLIADQVKTISGKDRKVDFAKTELELLDNILPAKFCLCLTPKIECRAIKVKKCNVMSSKKLPLWIVFENADPLGKDFYTIFKSGDDLRQDQLTLQLLRIMDSIWRGADLIAGKEERALDLRLKPYKCCSTGHDLGMIEVVVDSNTTANIQTEFGGRMTGAFSQTPIDMYLHANNAHDAYQVAVDNFVRTCAGYCVATYVLGIGDRHADNIMVTKTGHLFHIDFGHFLGNFKSKYGFKRERAPFVFTPEMAYVMRDNSNKNTSYATFERMCCEAYNMLRYRADLFINLFILMVPAGMPELLDKSDIVYLRDMLSIHLTTEQADAKFIAEIKNSLNTVSRRIDNWFHNLKHKN